MEFTSDKLYNTNFQSFEKPNFVTDPEWSRVASRLSNFVNFSKDAYSVIKQDKNAIPAAYATFITANVESIVSTLNDLYTEPKNQDGGQISNIKAARITQIISTIDQLTNIENQSTNGHNPSLIFTIVGAYRIKDQQNVAEIIDDKLKENELLFEKQITQSRTRAEEIISHITNKKEDIDQMLENLREATGYKIFLEYAGIFENKRLEHETIARRWLWVGISVLLLFVIFLLAPNLLPQETIDGKDWSVVPSILARVLFYATMVFAASFSLRQFSINKHLQATYAEKAINMNSFHLFMQSAANKEQVKDALLQHLAKAIFERTNSGHISENGPMMKSAFFEITKMINNQEKPN